MPKSRLPNNRMCSCSVSGTMQLSTSMNLSSFDDFPPLFSCFTLQTHLPPPHLYIPPPLLLPPDSVFLSLRGRFSQRLEFQEFFNSGYKLHATSDGITIITHILRTQIKLGQFFSFVRCSRFLEDDVTNFKENLGCFFVEFYDSGTNRGK